MRFSPLHYLAFLTIGFLFSCGAPLPPRQVHTAFYHWQTRLELQPGERQFLDKLGASRLYVKFFDVDWDGDGPVPLAPVQLSPATYAGLELVPTIFITNRTMKELSPAGISGLCQNILDKAYSLAAPDTTLRIREMQFDCDWTESTRDKYFELLLCLKDKLQEKGASLSATIRLHQVRFFDRTGVPPADRGMLMFYNMGQLEAWDEPNSILNLPAAEPYLKDFDAYPLSLDLALPLFRWGVLFRNGEMIRLLNQLSEERLIGSPKFKALGAGRFEVVEGTFLDGHYLYAGDLIRLEKVGRPQLEASAKRLAELPWPEELTISYYHLDGAVVEEFSVGFLEGLEERFGE